MPPIERIVVLMLENQSFDRLLGGLAPRVPGLDGVKPTAPLANPDWPSGAPIFQAPTRARTTAHDPGHDLDNVLRQIDRGSMSGFVADFAQTYPQSGTPERADILAWYPPGFLPALHLLAGQFVIADHWHASVPGPIWPNRFFAQSGTSLGHTDTPSGLFHPDLHLYDQRTLYDELNSAHVEWRVYYGNFPQSLAFTHQLEPANLVRYRPFGRFAADVAAADLPPFVFIEPAYFGPGENDQHPPQDVLRGDVLLADIYNALLAQPALFARTLLIVLHDESCCMTSMAASSIMCRRRRRSLPMRTCRASPSPSLVCASPPSSSRRCSTLGSSAHSSITPASSVPLVTSGASPRSRSVRQRRIHPSPRSPGGIRHAPLSPAPRAEVLPVASQPSLNTVAASLFAFSQHLESLITDEATRERLAAQVPAATHSAEAAGKLALARLDAFLSTANAPA